MTSWARGRRDHRDERGLAASVVVALAGLLVLVALACAAGGRLLAEQRIAARAADLAALSAASSVQRGLPGCASARETSTANGAQLTSCRVIGQDVVVEVAVAVTTLFGRVVHVRADARAGPVAE